VHLFFFTTAAFHTGSATSFRDDNSAHRSNMVSGTGVIKFLSFEGGFYGILSDDGERYDPSCRLNSEFQVDGLRVRFQVQIMHGFMGIHMWGKIAKVLQIEKIDQ
jgi:hypothetical protein